ncbi:MAG: NADPH-dependent glutamate synthase [Planctomycetes bacterium]|nr:NADPH-dependent glutamate synthase [Planctomycetota bacterium]
MTDTRKPKKERPPRQKMPEQDPKVRAKNFDEVPFGYDEKLAAIEASRCLQCKKPKCIEGCPVEVDIPGFIKLVVEGDPIGAARKIKETNSLPAICGRVCPQEGQCEARCVLGKKSDPVAIGRLERFAADYERNQGKVEAPEMPPLTGKKVAVVGSGPSGLTVAGELVKMGHEVTVFEAFHKAGGVLVYGIPEFRLPKEIVQAEVDYLKKLGVEIELNSVIGRLMTIDDLLGEEGFDAVYVATGAGAPKFLGIPGENLGGVYSASEYLTRSNLMKAYRFPESDTPIIKSKNVAVVGGGNVAMDSARTALRLGADNVYIVYRRSIEEAPARKEEIHHAEEEGVQFQFLNNPVEMIGDGEGRVCGLKCIKMKLGEPQEDSKGRLRRYPIPIEGSEFVIDVDTVIVAIGSNANPLIRQTTPDMKHNQWGYIEAQGESGATSKEGVFAGGDIVTGEATVISAMGAGRRAAMAIAEYLKGK